MFEWQSGEESWEQSPTPTSDSPQPGEQPNRYVSRRRVLLFLGALILTAALGAGTLHWQAGRGLNSARADLQDTIDQEIWARTTGNDALLSSLLDPQTSATWRRQILRTYALPPGGQNVQIEIDDVSLERPDLALVELTVHEGGGTVQRETRAYRRAGAAWLRTTPFPQQLWVQQERATTANLRFIFHAADSERIAALMPPLQELYSQILHDFNLVPPDDKRTLEVAISVQPANVGLDDPNLYDLTHLQNADWEALQCHLGSGLASRVLTLFDNEAGNWRLLLNAIRDWELRTWSAACASAGPAAQLAEVIKERPFIPVNALTQKQTSVPSVLGRLFVEFFVTQYGRDALANLALGMSRFEAWPELIEDLDLDYVELNNAWWDFLIEKAAAGTSTDVGWPASDPQQVRAAIQWMLDLESQAILAGDPRLYELLLDPAADQAWRQRILAGFSDLVERDIQRWGEVKTIELRGNQVEVVVQLEGPAVGGVRPMYSYPEQRTYRFAAGRWVRTSRNP